MSKQQTVPAENNVMIEILEFLRAPPEGTPKEIINAFGVMGAETALLPGLFLQTVEQAPVAISITDHSAHILYVNKAFEQLTGYQRDEILGKKQSILSSQSTPLSVYENLWATIQERRVWKGRLVNHHKDKSEYLAELTISPVLSDDGEISYFLGMHHDITEVHQLEQRLKFQKSLAEAAINVAPMVVAMVGIDRQVVMDNLAYKALLADFRGIEPAELFVDALEQQIGFNFDDKQRKNKEFTNVEVRLEPPGSVSSRWFSCSGVCVTRPDEAAENYFKSEHAEQRYLLLIANEVTLQRRRTNEARLNMIRSNMAEQQMVQTMREAISASIYKLQVPMNVMKAAILMPGAGNEECALRNTLQQSLDSSDEAMESLHSALPRPVTEQFAMVNVNAIVHEVIKLSTEQLLASGIVIDWRPAPVLPIVPGKANALRRLFKYLIDNAIEAVKQSGVQDKEIRLDTRIDDQEIIIEVIDNGIGLSEDMRLKVFEPFYCGWKKAAEHAGMGLTMAQEVIIHHQGSLEFDSSFFGGCRLFVRLPLNETGGD
ncbi:MAG: nitrogen fixation negative regulator NifL [gamma proteobacterium symbiont of Bathyaustriella thionipta]|nr:nitrogen fixation negative regulator NifL [gamma proteobacterium symbiont of Bathyaustriella thionipta]MCU7949487.1 nitrogen fixation negative regulator NifL [gamma proteobacterium symbiont of Bathyaustriella thionipta]MCU7952424.1 nitrogen fixation negative regulator NifL [gamma proteobacterium symbiont of Bathyaustriella thionipta]MCU7956073.1 nitrogen fixation negative regulator NifL [gamma proteobacterium symbiont of Bathyaustriella thionipta]MCU7968367.1 nitrogen fixation negative regul